MSAPTFCEECGCQTGGGTFCYKHAPYTVRPLKNGSFVVDRNGQRTVTFYEPPSPAGEGAQETLGWVTSDGEQHWRKMARDEKNIYRFTNREVRVLFAEIDRLRAALPPERAALMERVNDAVQYAVAVLGNHRDVASTFHAPIIQRHMDALREAAAALRGETGAT